MKRSCPLLLAGLWMCAAAAGSVPVAAAEPHNHVVTIDGMRFEPVQLTIRPGDRIVWVNMDLVPHTVTQQSFDSHTIAPGARWSHVVRQAGRYPYACALHPTMTGVVIVQ
jgi:plastocyanin